MGIDMTRLDDEEFADELNSSLFDDDLFRDFLDERVITRTRIELVNMSSHIRSQIEARAGEGDDQWRKRARNMLRRVESRISQINALIKQRNIERTATVEQASKKWGRLAFELARALSKSDMAYALDEIEVGELTARDWYEARREIEADRIALGKSSLLIGRSR